MAAWRRACEPARAWTLSSSCLCELPMIVDCRSSFCGASHPDPDPDRGHLPYLHTQLSRTAGSVSAVASPCFMHQLPCCRSAPGLRYSVAPDHVHVLDLPWHSMSCNNSHCVTCRRTPVFRRPSIACAALARLSGAIRLIYVCCTALVCSGLVSSICVFWQSDLRNDLPAVQINMWHRPLRSHLGSFAHTYNPHSCIFELHTPCAPRRMSVSETTASATSGV